MVLKGGRGGGSARCLAPYLSRAEGREGDRGPGGHLLQLHRAPAHQAQLTTRSATSTRFFSYLKTIFLLPRRVNIYSLQTQTSCLPFIPVLPVLYLLQFNILPFYIIFFGFSSFFLFKTVLHLFFSPLTYYPLFRAQPNLPPPPQYGKREKIKAGSTSHVIPDEISD
jgi:hypothetical protein